MRHTRRDTSAAGVSTMVFQIHAGMRHPFQKCRLPLPAPTCRCRWVNALASLVCGRLNKHGMHQSIVYVSKMYQTAPNGRWRCTVVFGAYAAFAESKKCPQPPRHCRHAFCDNKPMLFVAQVDSASPCVHLCTGSWCAVCVLPLYSFK